MSDAPHLPGESRQGPRRDTNGRSAASKTVAFSAARGAALIGLAVVIGIVLLQTVDTGTAGPIGDRTHTTVTTRASTSTTATTSTTTATPLRPPSQVTVQVLNGSGAKGAAATLTGNLAKAGYKMLTATDAPSLRTGTIVYYRAGWSNEAQALATTIAAGATAQPMPSAAVGDANAVCVVIIGG